MHKPQHTYLCTCSISVVLAVCACTDILYFHNYYGLEDYGTLAIDHRWALTDYSFFLPIILFFNNLRPIILFESSIILSLPPIILNSSYQSTDSCTYKYTIVLTLVTELHARYATAFSQNLGTVIIATTL